MRLKRLILVVVGLSAIAGCGKTQLEPKNRPLLQALQTAVTSKNTQWLDAVARQVNEQHDKRALSDAELQALGPVIESAQAADWKTAESRLFALIEGQKPTAADLAKVRERKTAAK